MNKTPQQLRAEILDLVREYHRVAFPAKPFDGAATSIPVAGRVFDDDDIVHLVDSSLDFWLTTGRYAAQFEREFAQFWGSRHAMLVNSGSSEIAAMRPARHITANRSAPLATSRRVAFIPLITSRWAKGAV